MAITISDLISVAPSGLIDISVAQNPIIQLSELAAIVDNKTTPIVPLVASLLEYYFLTVQKVNASRVAANLPPVNLVTKTVTGTVEAPILQYAVSFPVSIVNILKDVVDPTN